MNVSSVAWSVAGRPLASISATRLATAGIVYQSTNATAQGSFSGNTGTERTVTDLNASGPEKFYHIEITKP